MKYEMDNKVDFPLPDPYMNSLFPKGPKSTFHNSEKITIFFENNHIALYKFR